MIETRNAGYEYIRRDAEGNVEAITTAVSGIDIKIAKGSNVSIVGANGSGKSTLAKMFNALYIPTEGEVRINGKSTREISQLQDVHRAVGIVFQNPDNQIVGTTVEADVAFGLENLCVEQAEMRERVDAALCMTGLDGMQKVLISKLSGGQKQKLALAGILAMQPECIVLDEATAMLDAETRTQLLIRLRQLQKTQGFSIVQITHFTDEIADADTVIALSGGRCIFTGTPEQLWQRPEVVKVCGLRLPLAEELRQRYGGWERRMRREEPAVAMQAADLQKRERRNRDLSQALIFDNVSFVYRDARKQALSNISFAIERGECLAVAGHTGSGKSTLLQLANGLLRPTAGSIYYQGQDIWEQTYRRRELRQRVGLVFQYPEHQLFAETVYQDVVFGPYHMELSKVEAERRAFEAIRMMGLSDDIYDVSPFSLSGGQQRRVAIAGVLAMQPEILMLDEPTAGLDGDGKEELWQYLEQIKREKKMGILVVTHQMDEIAEHADSILVLRQGEVWMEGAPESCFSEVQGLREAGLQQPEVCVEAEKLRRAGIALPEGILRKQELLCALEKELRG